MMSMCLLCGGGLGLGGRNSLIIGLNVHPVKRACRVHKHPTSPCHLNLTRGLRGGEGPAGLDPCLQVIEFSVLAEVQE